MATNDLVLGPRVGGLRATRRRWMAEREADVSLADELRALRARQRLRLLEDVTIETVHLTGRIADEIVEVQQRNGVAGPAVAGAMARWEAGAGRIVEDLVRDYTTGL